MAKKIIDFIKLWQPDCATIDPDMIWLEYADGGNQCFTFEHLWGVEEIPESVRRSVLIYFGVKRGLHRFGSIWF